MALTQDTYERYQRRYGAETPDALACELNLACRLLRGRRQPPGPGLVARGPRRAYQAAWARITRTPSSAANNLAIYLRGAGQLAEARELAGRDPAADRGKLGEDHPFTLSCAVNLANCLGDLGDLAEAEAIERETTRGCARRSARTTRTHWPARPTSRSPCTRPGGKRRRRRSGARCWPTSAVCSGDGHPNAIAAGELAADQPRSGAAANVTWSAAAAGR